MDLISPIHGLLVSTSTIQQIGLSPSFHHHRLEIKVTNSKAPRSCYSPPLRGPASRTNESSEHASGIVDADMRGKGSETTISQYWSMWSPTIV